MHGVLPKSAFPPFAKDTEKLMNSWDELLKTNSKIFLPGHGMEIYKLVKKDYGKHKEGIIEN